jgi:hypothetical protein
MLRTSERGLCTAILHHSFSKLHGNLIPTYRRLSTVRENSSYRLVQQLTLQDRKLPPSSRALNCRAHNNIRRSRNAPLFYGTRGWSYVKSPPLVRILSQLKPVRTPPPPSSYFVTIYFNTVYLSTPRSYKWPISLDTPKHDLIPHTKLQKLSSSKEIIKMAGFADDGRRSVSLAAEKISLSQL